MAQPYDVFEENGTWTVYEIATGEAVRIRDVPQTGLEKKDADALAHLLNRLAEDGESGPKQ